MDGCPPIAPITFANRRNDCRRYIRTKTNWTGRGILSFSTALDFSCEMANVGTSFITASLLLDLPQLPGIWLAKLRLNSETFVRELRYSLFGHSQGGCGAYSTNQIDLETAVTNSLGRPRLYCDPRSSSPIGWMFAHPSP